MRKEYIVSTGKGKKYRSFMRIPMPFYCFGSSDITVYSAVKYSDARKFHFLRWATHRARFLSYHSGELYYVYTVVDYKDCIYTLQVVDDTINDKLIESNEKCQQKIEQLIADWRARKGLD